MDELLDTMTAIELAALADKKTAMDFQAIYNEELKNAANECRKPKAPSQIMIEMAESGNYPQTSRCGIRKAISRVTDAVNQR